MKRFALLLLAAPLVLAACGGGSSGALARVKANPVAYVKHAATRTVGTTEHMIMTGSMKIGDQSSSIHMSGDLASSPLRAKVEFALTDPGEKVSFSEIFDGATVYLHSPAGLPLPSGKTWAKLDLAALGNSRRVNLYLQSMSQSPAQALQRLEAAGTVKLVGADTIDGVQTTHYRVTNVDISKLSNGATLANPGQVQFGAIDVWVGDTDGYVYRETVPISVNQTRQGGTMTMEINFSKFGEAVHVTVPTAAETFDLTQALAGRRRR